ncbi:50S ribosomal protein L17 [Patescibacteria group bacterium]
MKHRKKGKKLGRDIKQRKALFKNLIRSLINQEEIKTTQAKAKAIKRLMDKLMTKAKKGSLSARRQVLSFLPDQKAVHKLFDVLAPRTKTRTSGFTRVIRLGQRKGDNTMMAKIEFVDQKVEESKEKASAKKSKPASTKRKRGE